MIYSIEEIKTIIKTVADSYDIEEIYLFGSYYDKRPTENSDVDIVIKYGKGCRGLQRISFAMELERQLKKEVDVINIEFQPEFMANMNFNDEGRKIYAR